VNLCVIKAKTLVPFKSMKNSGERERFKRTMNP